MRPSRQEQVLVSVAMNFAFASALAFSCARTRAHTRSSRSRSGSRNLFLVCRRLCTRSLRIHALPERILDEPDQLVAANSVIDAVVIIVIDFVAFRRLVC